MPTQAVTDNSFNDDVLESSMPVLVDFWAEWCAPCKQIGPVLEDLSDEMAEKIKVAKVNIEDSPDTPAKFHVRGIPTLMIFKGGQVVATKVGTMTKSKLTEWVSREFGIKRRTHCDIIIGMRIWEIFRICEVLNIYLET